MSMLAEAVLSVVKGLQAVAVGVGCFVGVAVLALMFFNALYVFMLAKLGRQLRETESYARQIWTNAP
jgi:hypothetical protein